MFCYSISSSCDHSGQVECFDSYDFSTLYTSTPHQFGTAVVAMETSGKTRVSMDFGPDNYWCTNLLLDPSPSSCSYIITVTMETTVTP